MFYDNDEDDRGMGQQPAPMQRTQAPMQRQQGRGIDWGAIMQRMRDSFAQRHPGMMGQPPAPMGAPPAAPQMDRGRLMGIAQHWGGQQQPQQQQPGGIVPQGWGRQGY